MPLLVEMTVLVLVLLALLIICTVLHDVRPPRGPHR